MPQDLSLYAPKYTFLGGWAKNPMLAAVQHGSVVSWHHVNLHGEYDFSDEQMQDSVGLHMPPAPAFSLS